MSISIVKAFQQTNENLRKTHFGSFPFVKSTHFESKILMSTTLNRATFYGKASWDIEQDLSKTPYLIYEKNNLHG